MEPYTIEDAKRSCHRLHMIEAEYLGDEHLNLWHDAWRLRTFIKQQAAEMEWLAGVTSSDRIANRLADAGMPYDEAEVLASNPLAAASEAVKRVSISE